MNDRASTGSAWSRREWLGAVGAAGLGMLVHGCAPRVLAPTRKDSELLAVHEGPLLIVQWRPDRPDPDSVLRREAVDAAQLRRWYLAALDDAMRRTLADAGGVGLAAPQVGISSRVILVQHRDERGDVVVCVDPVILERSDAEVEGWEACLSIRGVGGRVSRAREVRVAYHDLGGERRVVDSRDREARIFQHEIDHLHGVLYLDRLTGPLLPIEEMRRRRDRSRLDAADLVYC